MKIKDFRKPTNYQYLDIEPGTVFAKNDVLYMAIEPMNVDCGLSVNAVNLETGELTFCMDADFIQIVNAELCVR